MQFSDDGQASYHPHSALAKQLKESATGALELPRRISPAIQVPTKRGETVALVVPSRLGNLLDTVKVSARGVSRQVSYELVDKRVFGRTVPSLVEVSKGRADKLREGNKFVPARSSNPTGSVRSTFETTPAARDHETSSASYWSWRLSDRHPSAAKEPLFVRPKRG